MRYKKHMIILLAAIFLFAMATASATDSNNTAVAVEDTDQMELSAGNQMTVDNLKTSKNAAIVQTDLEVLGAGEEGTYDDLRDEIGSGGDINLNKSYYRYAGGGTIGITTPKFINGNGAVIDMAGSTIRAFTVSTSGVTFTNLTIKNANYAGGYGVIYFKGSGTVTNCNFINNTAFKGGAIGFEFGFTGYLMDCNFTDNKATSGSAGAVYILSNGNIRNCNFIGNSATPSWGGAIYMYSGSIENCNFTNNTASNNGAAVYFWNSGNVTNCNFDNNFASNNGGAISFSGSNSVCILENCNFTNNTANCDGGAVYFNSNGTVENCNFINNTASQSGGAVYLSYDGEVTNCNFVNNTASDDGGAVYFDEDGTVVNCNFTGNTATGTDSRGGAVYFNETGTVSNCNFTGNNATGEGGAVFFYGDGDVRNCNFTNNQADYGGAIRFNGEGTVENCNFTNNFAFGEGGAVFFLYGNVLNCNFTNNQATGSYSSGGAVYFNNYGNVTNCNFDNNTASEIGGAIWMSSGSVENCNFTGNTATYGGSGAIWMYFGTVSSCNFTNNKATYTGGAIYFDNSGNVENCNFTGNTATYDGGAVYFQNTGTVTNCNFTANHAATGSAIYFYGTSATKTVSNSRFLNNRANAETLEVIKNDNNITITFTGQNNLLNAIYSVDNAEVSFNNVTYWGKNGITTISTTKSGFNKEEGQNITVVVVNDKLVLSEVMVTDENGQIVLDIITGNNYYIGVRHDTDSYYTEAERTISTMKFNVNVTSQTTNNKTVNITAKSNIPNEIIKGKLLFILPNGTEINATYASNGTWWAVHTFDDYGVYQVNASYAGLGNVTVNKGTIAVTAPEHTFWFLNYTINGNDNLVINLNNDFYFDSAYDEEFANGITINRKLTINGNGHSINALQKARILQITAGNVVLNNITFANAIASDNGGAICMNSGNVENCNFAGNSAKQGGAVYFFNDGNVSDCNFTNNGAGSFGGAVYFFNDGNVSDCNFANNSAGNAGAVFIVNDGNVSDCNFANNSASGDCGAVLIVHHGNVANCNFTGNAATIDGGAVGMDSGSIANCNFVNNSASNSSGAVYFFYDVDVTNCNFTGNKAISGSAIYFYFTSGIKSISDSLFLNNRANADDEPFNVTINGNGVEITFKGLNNLLNAIYSRGDVKFSNVTYWGADGITNTDSFTPDISNRPAGQNITVKGIVNGNIINAIKGTDENGSIVLGDAGDYWIVLSHKEDSYYTEVAETLFTNMKLYANVTSLTTNNKTVNITAKSNIFNEVMPGKLLFVLSNSENITANYAGNGTWWAEHTFDDYGEFKVNASYVGLDNVAVNDATLNITKADSTITLDNITLNYGESKNVTIIAQGASGITANINGTNVTVINNYTIMIADLGAGNYPLTVTTVPDGDHNPVTATSKITVNKVESTLTVDNITFDYNSEGSGDVSFTGADKVIANVINQPKAVVNVTGKRITVSGLAAGTYTLNVTTVADENHTAVRETAAITVNKVNSTLTVGDVDLDYGESKNVTVTVQGATGITAKIDDVDVSVNDFIVPVSDLAAGIHILTVAVIPDENHTAVSETAIITVNKVNSTLTVGDVDLDYGESKNVTVKAQGAIGITAKVDDVDVGVIDFVVQVSDLAAGIHTLTVTSIPDENHTAVRETAIITVNKADSTLTVPAISFDYGDSGSSVVEFTGATGVVAVVNDLHAVVDVNGKTITVFNLTAGTYILTVTTIPDDNHNEVTKTAAVTVLKQDVDVNISMPENVTAGEKSTVNVVLPGDASGNVVAKVDGEIADNVTVADGSASLEIPSLGGGNHTIEIVYSGDGNYKSASKTAILTVGRDSTNITAADVTSTYKVNKYLVIKLTDSRGNPLANAIVTVELTAAKNYTSDENGQIKVKVSNLVPKTYAAKITFKGNDNYTGSNTTAEVTVKKATAKITAKAKTFSTTTKTKKYTITLKDSKGNPIKKAVVSLKVNGNTYKATTNSKGKATFKITKLSNKGTYKATVTFKANKYYKKATKNAKITVKSVWKTVAKGSKNHAIVKKIQRVLKSNGYYLSYNGHYLMVDGIYHDYTKMAVKQFQKANGLKVTGKVDEKTAKKLGII